MNLISIPVKAITMVVTVLIFFLPRVLAQITFQRTYGDSTVNDVGYNLIQTSDGGFLIAGTHFNSGNAPESILLIRTDSTGDTLWTKKIRETALDYSAGCILETYDGGFVIAGTKGGLTAFVPYLIKVDSAGNVLWNQGFLWLTQERIYSVVETHDQGFLLAGFLYNQVNDLVYFIRTDMNGDTLWTKSYGETGYHADVYSVVLAPDGGFVATGSITDMSNQDTDAFLMKTDSLGNFLWAYGFGGAGYDYAQCVQATSDGGYVIAGVNNSLAYSAYWLIKTDGTGHLAWSNAYGGNSDDRSETVKELPDGGFLIAGESASFSAGNFNCFLIRTNSQGDTVWTRELDQAVNNEAYGLTLTSNGGFAITGYRTNPNGRNDVLLLTEGLDGNTSCTGRPVAAFIINTSLTITTNHTLSLFSTQPGVYSYNLDITSGCSEQILCIDDRIPDLNGNKIFSISPNPTQDNIRIEEVGNLGSGIISIHSIDGAKVVSQKFSTFPSEINIETLPPGIYFLKVLTSRGSIHFRFIKI